MASGTGEVVLETSFPGIRLAGRGKVRDIYDLGDHLLIVATDRISAFDVILPTGIPDKGRVLTSMSRFWFELIGDIIPNQVDPAAEEEPPAALAGEWSSLAGRSMIVRKAQPFPVECVVRGYLSGSAWKEYRENSRATSNTGQISCAGVLLPPGMVESSKLPEPVFTPTTKAASGHDMPMTFAEVEQTVGAETAAKLRDDSIAIYQRAANFAAQRGIIIADTKFEFGLWRDQVILIDEVLTPDSSRFWDLSDYAPGRAQASYDKQFVRDYLESLSWDKTPPAPTLPEDIVERTAQKYRQAYQRIVGRELQTP